jgi:DNA-binding LytR/AlgR family response regulator
MPEGKVAIKAIVADDETPSRDLLISQLMSVWPDLVISGVAENGLEAKEMIETLRPDCAFLDIKMPGLSGMQVARETAGLCRVVFITAYDQYAIEAFENEAIDYILKPASEERLKKTVKRLKARIASQSPVRDMAGILERLMPRVDGKSQERHLRWIRVQVKDSVVLVPVEKIYFFKAKDRYTLVVTRRDEFLIKKTITELSQELDPDVFFRIHRGTIVNAHFIEKVSHLPSSRGQLTLKDRHEIHTISRPYSHLFKQM